MAKSTTVVSIGYYKTIKGETYDAEFDSPIWFDAELPGQSFEDVSKEDVKMAMSSDFRKHEFEDGYFPELSSWEILFNHHGRKLSG